MARQVKIDFPSLPVPFTYTGNSVYHRGPLRIRAGSAADRLAELQGAKNNSPRDGEKTLDCTVYLTRIHAMLES